MSQQGGQQGMYNPGGYNVQGNQSHMNSMPQQQQQPPQDFMRGSMGGMQMPGMGQFQGGGAGGNFNGTLSVLNEWGDRTTKHVTCQSQA